MGVSVLIVLANLLLGGVAVVVACVVGYVLWLILRDERKYRQERARETQRRGYWGYE